MECELIKLPTLQNKAHLEPMIWHKKRWQVFLQIKDLVVFRIFTYLQMKERNYLIINQHKLMKMKLNCKMNKK